MVDTGKIIITLVFLLVFSLIALYVYNKISTNSTISPTPILSYVLIGFFVFGGIKLAEQFGSNKLDLDTLILPVVTIIGIILIFIYVPSLLTQTFSTIDSNIQPVKSPLTSISFSWYYLLIPFAILLLHKPYRNDIKRRLHL